jgi:hypothetical protein
MSKVRADPFYKNDAEPGMGSKLQVKADLADLSERIRTVADALKRFPADQASVPEKIEDLCEEVRSIAAQLRAR